jgi:hypothetical protein
MKKTMFTRKFTSTQKNNPHADIIIHLHRALNRVDVSKDAFNVDVPVVINTKLFNDCANYLFGKLPMEDYSNSLMYINTYIKAFESHETNEIVISDYSDKANINFLPNFILYGIQDAGISPERYNKNINVVITPGSYLDPASRSRGTVLFGFNKTLTNKDFINIGMPIITNLKSNLTDTTYNVDIELRHKDHIITSFSSDFKPTGGDVSYFSGNSVKNKYIDRSNANVVVIVKYILCKELGDTLQAMYGKLFAQELVNGVNKVCLFTNDNILTLRSKLLGLQVVYNVKTGKFNRIFYHHPVMTSITDAFISMWKENIRKHNDIVISGIRLIMSKGRYNLLNGRTVSVSHNDAIKDILNQYISNVDNKTSSFNEIKPEKNNIEAYRKCSIEHQMPRLFIDNVLNSIAIGTIFFTNAQRNILMDVKKKSMAGGGSELPPFEFTSVDDDFTIDRDYTDLDSSSTHTKRILYLLLSNKYPEESKNKICFMVESISSMLYLYFNYMGASSSDVDFIRRIIDEYESQIFGKMSFVDFERMYKPWTEDEMRVPVRSQGSHRIRHNIIERVNSNILPDKRNILLYGGHKTRKIKHNTK